MKDRKNMKIKKEPNSKTVRSMKDKVSGHQAPIKGTMPVSVARKCLALQYILREDRKSVV